MVLSAARGVIEQRWSPARPSSCNRPRAVAEALASVRAEGLEPGPECLERLEAIADGRPDDHGGDRAAPPALPQVSWDPYLDLEAGVLRNRLGITDSILSVAPRRHLSRPDRSAGGATSARPRTTSPTCRRSTGSFSATSTTGPASCAPSRSARVRCSARPTRCAPGPTTCSPGSPAPVTCAAVRATASSTASPRCWRRSTPCTRSGRATAAPSALSWASWPAPPGIPSAGRLWIRRPTSPPPGPPTSDGDTAPLRALLDSLVAR